MTKNQFEKNSEQRITLGAPDIAPAPSESVEEIKKVTRKKRVNRIKDLEAIDWKKEMDQQALADEETAKLKAQMVQNQENKEVYVEDVRITKEVQLPAYKKLLNFVNNFSWFQKSEAGKPLAKKGDVERILPLNETVKDLMDQLKKGGKGIKFYDLEHTVSIKDESSGKYQTGPMVWELKQILKKGGKYDFVIAREDNPENVQMINESELENKIHNGDFKVK